MSAAVSIIVPCYNVAPYLDKCMESLTLQTLGDLEIISVNDGSGDDTPAILRAWAERDGRIRVVDRENGGLSAARNTGMALAGGEYIGFVDPDDYVEHSMYGRLLEKARRSDADVTACGYTGFSDRDGSMLDSCIDRPAEDRLDLLRCSVGSNIPVIGHAAQKTVPYTASDYICFIICSMKRMKYLICTIRYSNLN